MNAQTRSGKVSSPHRAAYSGHMSVINLLIKYGADPRLCDSDGPFHKQGYSVNYQKKAVFYISLSFHYHHEDITHSPQEETSWF